MARTRHPPTHTTKKKGTVSEQGDESIKASKNDTTTGLVAAARRTSPRASTSARTKVPQERDNISTASGGTSGKSRYVREICLTFEKKNDTLLWEQRHRTFLVTYFNWCHEASSNGNTFWRSTTCFLMNRRIIFSFLFLTYVFDFDLKTQPVAKIYSSVEESEADNDDEDETLL
jgi:hypothetical protein